jgi:hypothetical protein
MTEIFLGVISGVLTALLLFFAVWAFNSGISPWYQKFIYKGVDIAGAWSCKKEVAAGITFTWHMNLKQSAHRVTGEMVIIKRATDGREDVAQLSLKGELWEGFLNATLRSKDRTRLSFGSMLCKVTGGGRSITGKYIYRNLANDEIAEQETVFVKVLAGNNA